MIRASVVAFAMVSGCGTSEPTSETRPPTPTPVAASAAAPAPPPVARPAAFLKGQLHLHSAASGDSETPPATVVRWYAQRGYDFVVFTDHNRVTEVDAPAPMLALPGVELTQNLPTCTPPPEPGLQCLLHVNALVVDPDLADAASRVPQPGSDDRVQRFGHALRVADAMGGIAQLNHPNFHYAADAEDLVALAERGLRLFEVANEAWDSNNGGDADHPSTEALWDAALTAGARLYGTATDDAHHYDDAAEVRARGDDVFVGDEGWVMVRAPRNAAAIREALRRGDFYASTGVRLDDVRFVDGVLTVVVAADAEGDHEIAFIADGGATVASVAGRRASYDTRGKGHTYVRAIVVDARGRRAWVQPVFPGA